MNKQYLLLEVYYSDLLLNRNVHLFRYTSYIALYPSLSLSLTIFPLNFSFLSTSLDANLLFLAMVLHDDHRRNATRNAR